MKNITLRSQVGADGRLHLNIPTNLSNTELEVVIWLRPVNVVTTNKTETFSQWWAKQFTTISSASYPKGDARFDYLAERYQL